MCWALCCGHYNRSHDRLRRRVTTCRLRKMSRDSRNPHVARIVATSAVAPDFLLAPASAVLLDDAPREAVTTSIHDALPVAQLLGRFLQGIATVPSRSTRFPAGYFGMHLQSYCLHAGTYGLTKGDGYLLAPLEGDRAPLIRSQQDIQQLI